MVKSVDDDKGRDRPAWNGGRVVFGNGRVAVGVGDDGLLMLARPPPGGVGIGCERGCMRLRVSLLLPLVMGPSALPAMTFSFRLLASVNT